VTGVSPFSDEYTATLFSSLLTNKHGQKKGVSTP